MKLEAGTLRHRITIQRNTVTQDPQTGAMVSGWADLATVWARVDMSRVARLVSASAAQSEVRGAITIRWRDDVTASCRVLWRGQVYRVLGITPDNDSAREALEMQVSGGVALDG